MREFQDKRKVRKILYSKLSLVVLLIVLFFAARSTWNVYSKQSESMRLRSEAETRLAVLQGRKDDMANANAELGTPEGVEKQVRESYHMTKIGEQMVVIEDAPTTTPQVVAQGFFANVWQSILQLFGS